MLYHWIYPLLHQFKYITFRSACAAVVAFLICIIVGPLLIKLLRNRNIAERAEKKDSDHLIMLHRNKASTPTMGGLIILIAILISTLLWARLDNIFVFYALLLTFGLGVIGFADDYIKLTSTHRHGLSKSSKLLGQFALGLVIGFGLWYYFRHALPEGTRLHIPLIKTSVELGIFYPLFVALVITASSNAVNLTDGLDGLAIGCLIMAGLAYAVMVYISGRVDYTEYLRIPYIPGSGELTIFMAALVGAGLGFLWFNCFPAQIFMGDTGALALGGMLGFVAICAKQELVLFLVGAIFVIEAVSVILQIISFRIWRKRIFLIAPLHHHYQFAGLAEPKITIRFWIAAAILALMSLATLKIEL